MFTFGAGAKKHTSDGAHDDEDEEGAPLPGAEGIAEDIVKWASRRQGAALDSKREEELRGLHRTAVRQVELLRPSLQAAAVVTELQQSGLLSYKVASRGEAAMAKSILTTLLLSRLGEGGTSFPHWEEAGFQAYLQETVAPLTPFRCRTFTPPSVRRVLLLLHGSLVAGDDLASEAEVLQRLLPETAIVLPEAPLIVDEEHGLRSWWPPSESPGPPVAPEACVRRLVATVYWVRRHVGSVPLVIGGFSQGSQLAVSSLGALRRAGLEVRGLLVLSGLAAAFEVPAGTRCLAIHGGRDAKIPADLARRAASEMQEAQEGSDFRYEEVERLGHEISDDELERIAGFCNEAAPVDAVAGAGSAERKKQDAQQAKLLRYIKRMSVGLQMFDKDWFMVNICDLKMVGLGPESPALGGDALRYHLHDAGPEARGLVVVFHGLVSNLRREMDPLCLAYLKTLKLSVCLVDYRQRTSCLNTDAQMCLDELERLSGSSSKPVILHGIGLGATLAIHMSMACQVAPAEVGQRLRLLVLDAAMGAIHMNVGCTTKDPIGNDSKLAYVRLPICALGGEDKLCGLTVGDTQWNQVTAITEELKVSRKISRLTLIPDTALKDEGGERSLHPQLVEAVCQALEEPPRAPEAQGAREEDFVRDVLDVSEDLAHEMPEDDAGPWVPQQGFSPKDQLAAICAKVLDAAATSLAGLLAEAMALSEPGRSEQLVRLMLPAFGRQLQSHGGFKPGVEGLRQFDAAILATSEFFPDLQELHRKVNAAYDLELLRRADKDALASLAKAVGAGECKAEEAEAGGFKVLIKHMTKGGEMALPVPESATILVVRKAIMAKLKETNINKIKLVMPAAKGTKMIPDGEPLNGRTELLMVGRPLQ
uniref:Phospholipase/carboxylesterase/thioesterase domain-containing protein n=1 Tax=Alexandrium monilatum TaxID=311494 RepID=A0A7S4SR51_9DINO